MSPRVIAETAEARGLNAVALTDHQSTLNCPAFAACCADVGLEAWFGLELCTAEEVHVLALFDRLERAMAFGERFIDTLPLRANRLDVFGEQVVVEPDETIVGFEWRMLAAASAWPLEHAVGEVRAAGGFTVAAHVDRPSFSVLSQLGFLTGREGFDAIEISARASWAEVPEGLCQSRYPVLRSSDAHTPREIARQWNEAWLERFGIDELREALRAGQVVHRRRDG